jgi:threonine dehydratase
LKYKSSSEPIKPRWETLSNEMNSNSSRETYQNLTLSIKDIEEARGRIADTVLRTPLVKLNYEKAPCQVFLKLECLQPTGSFKVRGAGNAIALVPPKKRPLGVYTCSAGNMAQALAWHAKRLGIPCTVIVPENAPDTKLAAIERFGANTIKLSWDEVWKVATSHYYSPLGQSTFIHPFADPHMIAGNGTIGLEILEDLPDADSIIVPFGGGGLFAGIATAVKARQSKIKTFASEVETAAPLSASLKADMAKEIKRIPSFVDGIGAQNVLEEMWALVRQLVTGSIVVSLQEVAYSIKLLAERNRIIAEGAAGTSLSAALSGKAGNGKVVCVISGGNIDFSKLANIFEGKIP